MRIAITVLLFFTFSIVFAQTPADGTVRTSASGAYQTWDAVEAEWISIDEFWARHVARRGGLTWGRGDKYPQYENASEHDTFLVQLPQGPCLMEFFHSRWRRANDVRRWDDAFNIYGGCPYVFD